MVTIITSTHHQYRQHGQHRGGQRARGLLQSHLNGIDVVGDPAEQLAVPVRVDIGQWEPVQLLLELGAQALHHFLDCDLQQLGLDRDQQCGNAEQGRGHQQGVGDGGEVDTHARHHVHRGQQVRDGAVAPRVCRRHRLLLGRAGGQLTTHHPANSRSVACPSSRGAITSIAAPAMASTTTAAIRPRLASSRLHRSAAVPARRAGTAAHPRRNRGQCWWPITVTSLPSSMTEFAYRRHQRRTCPLSASACILETPGFAWQIPLDRLDTGSGRFKTVQGRVRVMPGPGPRRARRSAGNRPAATRGRPLGRVSRWPSRRAGKSPGPLRPPRQLAATP